MIRTKTSAKIDARQNKYNYDDTEIIYVLDKIIVNNNIYYIDPYNNIINDKLQVVGIYDNINNKNIINKDISNHCDEIHSNFLYIINN